MSWCNEGEKMGGEPVVGWEKNYGTTLMCSHFFVHNLKCLYLTHAIALLHITSVMVTLHCKALFYKCIHHIVKNYFCLFINLSIANLFICSLKDSNVILAQHRTLNDFVSHHGIKSFCAWFVVFFERRHLSFLQWNSECFPLQNNLFQETFFFIKHSFPRDRLTPPPS